MPRFHALKVADVRPETDEATSIAFEVPADLRKDFDFAHGQYLTLRADVDGQDLRRAYSICSAVGEGELRIAVKRIPDGRFSNFANENIRPGDVIEVMPPDGRFTVPIAPEARRHYAGYAGGSGITPFLSIVRTVLAGEPDATFTLFYGNRTVSSIIFREQLGDLKDRYLGRFRLFHVLSDELTELPLFSGLMDRDKIAELSKQLLVLDRIDYFFVCGPGPMMEGAQAAFAELGIDQSRIKMELFGTPPPQAGAKPKPDGAAGGETSEVHITRNGIRSTFALERDGASILDAALARKVDLPFACKGGVCCTCRAKLLEGEVCMDVNYGLDEDELEAGYILTCQAHPVSGKLVVDFDG